MMMIATMGRLRQRAVVARRSLCAMANPTWRATPNPLARELVLPQGSALLPESDVTLRFQRPFALDELQTASPIVGSLVSIDAVQEVLIGSDRLTINVEEGASWNAVGPRVSTIVSEALQCGPVPASAVARLSELAGATGPLCDEAWLDGSVEADIVEILETHIRPHVRDDGGDVRFCGFDHERGAALVQLVGACSGCPSSAATLQGRVAQLLKHFVPEVMAVEALSEAEAAVLHATSPDGAAIGEAAAAPPLGSEKVSIEEHMRRLLAEGAETSMIWHGAHSRPIER